MNDWCNNDDASAEADNAVDGSAESIFEYSGHKI